MKLPGNKVVSISAASAIILSLGLGTVPAASADSNQNASSKLAQEIGQHGAKMGQGLDRIKNNQNPQSAVPDQGSFLGKSSFTAQATWRPAGVQGLDVSSWQGTVNWAAQKSMGARFAYVKATEGTGYKSPAFGQQYMGAYNAGLIRGAYHFALPSTSSGKAQADYFVNNGGGWSGDGKTLPPLLDVEYNPYPSLGNMCYNMTPAQMVTWISDFSKQMIARTGRAPAIYTTNDWWKTCTGNSTAFKNNPLHLASYSTVVGAIPASWQYYSIWQYSDSGPFAGDSNVWNGTEASLATFARGAAPVAPKPVAPKPPVAAPKPPVTKPVVKAPVAQFRDVPSTHPYFTEINWMKTAGITTGWSAGIYNPNAVVNRGDLSVFLYRVAGKPAYTAPKVSRFKDVKVGHPFYKEIHWAAAKGLSTGWADKTYRPTLAITRDAMAVYMYRAAGSPRYTAPKTSLYKDVKDVKVGSAGYKEIHWLMATGVGSVWADKTYRPRVALTRSAAAYYLYRFDKKF